MHHDKKIILLIKFQQPVHSDGDFEVLKLDVSQKSSNASSSTQTTAVSHSNGSSEGGGDALPSANNPLYKWVVAKDGSAVNNMEFSPCGKYLAVVTQVIACFILITKCYIFCKLPFDYLFCLGFSVKQSGVVPKRR